MYLFLSKGRIHSIILRLAKCCKFPKQVCVVFRTSVLASCFQRPCSPSDFVLAPPALRRMLLVGAANGQTHPSHWLGFWGETSLWSCAATILIPSLAFPQEWFSVLAAALIFNGELLFPFQICLTFVSSHLFDIYSVYSDVRLEDKKSDLDSKIDSKFYNSNHLIDS